MEKLIHCLSSYNKNKVFVLNTNNSLKKGSFMCSLSTIHSG